MTVHEIIENEEISDVNKKLLSSNNVNRDPDNLQYHEHNKVEHPSISDSAFLPQDRDRFTTTTSATSSQLVVERRERQELFPCECGCLICCPIFLLPQRNYFFCSSTTKRF